MLPLFATGTVVLVRASFTLFYRCYNIINLTFFLFPLVCSSFYQNQEGASRDVVEQLPRYNFRRVGDTDKLSGEAQGPSAGVMTESGTDSPIEHHISHEDAVRSSNRFPLPLRKKKRSLISFILRLFLSLKLMIMVNCRNVAFAYVIMMMELSFGNFPVLIIFIPPA